MDQLLDLRAELLVGVKLLRAGVLDRISKETPDFECRWQQTDFGVEVTTRARPEVGSAMHDLLEKGLQGGPDVGVTLARTGALLFSESPEKTAGIAGQVITSIKDLVAAAACQPVCGDAPQQRGCIAGRLKHAGDHGGLVAAEPAGALVQRHVALLQVPQTGDLEPPPFGVCAVGGAERGEQVWYLALGTGRGTPGADVVRRGRRAGVLDARAFGLMPACRLGYRPGGQPGLDPDVAQPLGQRLAGLADARRRRDGH